ncbi:MAG: DUF421 domain-containing protein [Clostridia bacterium]|nr:DUF421 domain-containing protein [Clostridia bacterium]
MLIPLIRTLILYFFIIFSMRFMGKRQVGEMQPAELVITILISAVASVPMQDIELPLVHGIIPIITLVSAEVIISSLSLKCPRLRTLISGRPITIIRDGNIDQRAMRSLRITLDDLMEDLRLIDVYDLRTVRLAQMETNGRLSVLVDAKYMPPSAKDLSVKVSPSEPFCPIICDGKLVDQKYSQSEENRKWLNKTMRKNGVKDKNEVFLLACDRNNNVIFVKKGGL